jgi:glutamate carboxypeptidase
LRISRPAEIDVRVPTMADAARIDAGDSRPRSGSSADPPGDRRWHRTALRSNEQPPSLVCTNEPRAPPAGWGRHLEEGAAGGGSDGNFTGAVGVPTLDGLGPEGEGAHAHHEHVVIAHLGWRAAFIAELLASFAE